MKACPHCGGTGRIKPGDYDDPATLRMTEPCPAEHVVIAEKHPYEGTRHNPRIYPFFADPASVPMWWCRVHKQMACSSDHGRQDHPTHCSDWHRWGKTGYDCVMVPANEPVTYELWNES